MAIAELNQILITKKSADSRFVVGADLFEIASQVTKETNIQSVATTAGNEHTFEMFPEQCLVVGKVPSGLIVLAPSPVGQNNEAEQLGEILSINLKA